MKSETCFILKLVIWGNVKLARIDSDGCFTWALPVSFFRDEENQNGSEQTQALSLVTRKVSTPSASVSSEVCSNQHSPRAFVSLESSRLRKTRSEENQSFLGGRTRPASVDDGKTAARPDLRCFPGADQRSHSPSISRKASFPSYISPRGASLIPPQDAPYPPASAWSFTPSSSAFRYPHQRTQAVFSPNRHFSSPHLDMQQKLISSLTSPSGGPSAGPLKPPAIFPNKSHLHNPLYSPLQSTFPFSSSQIPFPLLPAFHQGALASALAAGDYGRLRESLDSAGLRHLGTRTGTRDPIKSRGELGSRSGHSGAIKFFVSKFHAWVFHTH